MNRRQSSKPLFSPTRFRQLATLMLGGVLISSTLVTADSVSVYEGKSLPQVMAIFMAILFAVLGAMPLGASMNGTANTTGRSRFRRGPLLLGIFVVWLLLSSFWGAQSGLTRLTWNGFWHVVALIGFALGMRSICAGPAASRVVLQLVLFCALFQSVYALHQYAVSMPAARAAYLKDPEGELLKADIDAPPGSPLRAQYEARLLGSFEPSGTFALTNSLAVLLSGAIVAWAILLTRCGVLDACRWKQPAQRGGQVALTVSAISLLLVVIVWLLTKSRTGVLAVMVMAVVSIASLWWLRRGTLSQPSTSESESTGTSIAQPSKAAPSPNANIARVPLQWIIAGASVLVFIFGVLVLLLSRDTLILSEAPKSVAYRLEYWQATSRMIMDHPWTGIGLGNFQSYYPRYKLPTASETIADPHNWCFDVAACLSVPALVIVLLALFIILSHAWQQIVSLESRARNTALDDGASNAADSSSSISFDDSNSDADMARHLGIGAALGWTVTAALQILARESFEFEPSLLGLIVGVVAIGTWSRWIVPSMATVRLAALIGLCTMLVALLASGSWQASGIALPMLALLAIAWPVPTSNNQATARSSPQGQQPSLKPQPVLVGGMFVVLAAFLVFTWRPVNASWTAKEMAASDLKAGDIPAALEHVQQSIAADPYNIESQRLLVQIFSMATEDLANGDGQRFQQLRNQVDIVLDGLLKVGGVSYLNWSFACQTQMTLAASATKVGDPSASKDCLKRAAELNQQAITLYPSSVGLHAQQATLWALLSENNQLKQELDTAFSLSQATPHTDRKLATQQVWLPASLAADWPAASVVRPSEGSPWVQAEPLCEALRSNSAAAR